VGLVICTTTSSDMNQNEPTDHWANLAAELGAQPASEPPRDKPGDRAIGPDAAVQRQSAIPAPAAAVTGDSGQQAGSASSGVSASQPESRPRADGTYSASRPVTPAAPTTPQTQTKSSWDILAEQLGVSSEQTAEARKTDVAGAPGLASSARQAEGPGALAIGEGVGHRPAGAGRPRRQPAPTRFGEGIFDEGPSADAVHSAGAAGEAVRHPWQPAELPQAEAGSAAVQLADLAGQQLAAQEPAVSASAQRPAERKSGRRRRKKRRGQESASTTKPQPAFDAPKLASARFEPEASDAESEPGQDWREQVEADEDWHKQIEADEAWYEPPLAEQRATHQTEQVAEAEKAGGVQSTEAYGAPIGQEDLVQPPDRPEALEQPQAAVAESAPAGGQAAESAASARSESPKHRAIPTWAEAISVIINANLEARARRGDAGRDRRERGGR
jgi:hypothetical protein